MDKALRMPAVVILFLIFFCISTDINSLGRLKMKTKDSLDLATKAAALQIDKNPTLISNGVFLIDNDKAKDSFLKVMALNLNTNIDTIKKSMVEYKAINPSYTIDSNNNVVYQRVVYTEPSTGDKYNINNPSFISSLKFEFKGLLLKKTIVISNNFGGSQLYTK